MPNTKSKYAIAASVEEGKESSFVAGPFDAFPSEEHANGAIVFEVGPNGSVQVQAPVPTMDSLVGHEFDGALKSTLGQFDIYEAIQREISRVNSGPSSKETLAEIIQSLDSLVLDYAYEARYDRDHHEEVIKDVVAWKSLRKQIWSTLAP